MNECGCPLAEMYAKAAQERDALTAYVGKLQQELNSAKAKAADWHGAYEVTQRELDQLRGQELDRFEIDTLKKEGD